MFFRNFLNEDKIDILANQAATSPKNDLPEPTDQQKKTGNYKKGKLKFHGFNISIENPAGSYRSGTDPNGKKWKTKLYHHYGYIEGTKGKDKDALDVFIGPDRKTKNVFIVNQRNDKGEFDEHKILMGFSDYQSAVKGYLKNYEPGWEKKGLLGSISMTNVDGLKRWIKNGNVNKPFESSMNEDIQLLKILLEQEIPIEDSTSAIRVDLFQNEDGTYSVTTSIKKDGKWIVLSPNIYNNIKTLEQAQKIFDKVYSQI